MVIIDIYDNFLLLNLIKNQYSDNYEYIKIQKI